MFKKLGLAVTFSPTGKALLFETKRLCDLLGAEIVFIHNGNKTTEIQEKLTDLITSAGYDNTLATVEWVKGDIANTIIKKAKEKNVDLLIIGALEKENIIKYFFGSVARKIMHNAKCSVLILDSPSEKPIGFKKFCVSVEYTPQSKKMAQLAFHLALMENAEEFIIISEYHVPGLSLAIQDGASIEKVEAARKQWQEEEEEKMKFFVSALNLRGLDIKTKCLYGKEGWEANNFVRENNYDLFIVSNPIKNITLFDRIFPHYVEYSIEKLPSNLLIIR